MASSLRRSKKADLVSLPSWRSYHTLCAGVVLAALLAVAQGCYSCGADPPVGETGALASAPRVVRYTHPPVIVDESLEIAHDFNVTNDTNTRVEIVSVKSSCGCLEAAVRDRVLEPGATTVLALRMRSRRGDPARNTTCVLETDQAGQWVYEMDVVSYPRVQFVTEHGSLYLGRAGLRDSPEGTVRVYTHALEGEEPPVIREVRAATDDIHAAVREEGLRSLGNGVSRRVSVLSVRRAPGSASGRRSSAVLLHYAAGGKAAVAELPVSWQNEEVYEIRPAALFLGSLDPNKPVEERTVTIRRRDGKPLAVTSVNTSHPGLVARLEDSSGQEECRSIRVSVATRSVTDVLSDVLTVVTNCPAQPTIRIPISALKRSD